MSRRKARHALESRTGSSISISSSTSTPSSSIASDAPPFTTRKSRRTWKHMRCFSDRSYHLLRPKVWPQGESKPCEGILAHRRSGLYVLGKPPECIAAWLHVTQSQVADWLKKEINLSSLFTHCSFSTFSMQSLALNWATLCFFIGLAASSSILKEEGTWWEATTNKSGSPTDRRVGRRTWLATTCPSSPPSHNPGWGGGSIGEPLKYWSWIWQIKYLRWS